MWKVTFIKSLDGGGAALKCNNRIAFEISKKKAEFILASSFKWSEVIKRPMVTKVKAYVQANVAVKRCVNEGHCFYC